MNDDIRHMISEIAALMKKYPEALESKAQEIQVTGNDPEMAGKLAKGADAMRDSGNLYLTWARHYAALSEGNPEASDDEDESDFGV